jgi:hypothetical protein
MLLHEVSQLLPHNEATPVRAKSGGHGGPGPGMQPGPCGLAVVVGGPPGPAATNAITEISGTRYFIFRVLCEN